MHTGKPAVISIAALLLIAVTYIANGALTRSDAPGREGANSGNSGLAALFSGGEDTLETRVEKLEGALQNANQIQAQLLDLVEELRQRLEKYTPDEASLETRTAALKQANDAHREDPDAELSRRERYRKYRTMQLQRLIDAGLNPERAEFILRKQERFQYEHMQVAYEYRHLQNKSSDEAQALKEKLNIYSHPRKMFEHELSPQEFELYLDVNGGRQEMQVDNVISDTPAFNAGLQPGDKIISYNGQRVFHMGDLRQQVYRVSPGETVAVEVQRAGSSSTEVIYMPSGPLGIQG